MTTTETVRVKSSIDDSIDLCKDTISRHRIQATLFLTLLVKNKADQTFQKIISSPKTKR